jgi:uncharacterized protein YegP (UPF0339 family)
MKTRIETYKDKDGDWRWRLVHQNGNILADSAEGYKNMSDMMVTLTQVRFYLADTKTPIEEVE